MYCLQLVRLVPGQTLQLQQIQTSSGTALIAVPTPSTPTPPPQPPPSPNTLLKKAKKKLKKKEDEPARLDLANIMKLSGRRIKECLLYITVKSFLNELKGVGLYWIFHWGIISNISCSLPKFWCVEYAIVYIIIKVKSSKIRHATNVGQQVIMLYARKHVV